MDPNDALQFIDENTIGIIVILGSTYTGHFENVALMSKLRKSFSSSFATLIILHPKSMIYRNALALTFPFTWTARLGLSLHHLHTRS